MASVGADASGVAVHGAEHRRAGGVRRLPDGAGAVPVAHRLRRAQPGEVGRPRQLLGAVRRRGLPQRPEEHAGLRRRDDAAVGRPRPGVRHAAQPALPRSGAGAHGDLRPRRDQPGDRLVRLDLPPRPRHRLAQLLAGEDRHRQRPGLAAQPRSGDAGGDPRRHLEERRLLHGDLPRRAAVDPARSCTRPRRSTAPPAGASSATSPGRCSPTRRCSSPSSAPSPRCRRSITST